MSLINSIVSSARRDVKLARAKENRRTRAKMWTSKEDAFLRANLGVLTDEEIGHELGRSAVAVHLRWERDLNLPAPSKAPGVLTAHRAAAMLGVDSHKICHWLDIGFIPNGRIMAGGRKIRLLDAEMFKRWVLNPLHWMYFDIQRVRDPKLKSLLMKREKRWGDEWWSTARVAQYHGVDTGDVKRYIKLKRLPAKQIEVSYGGRNFGASWAYWFVLKSDAVKLKFIGRAGKGSPGASRIYTPAALAWIVEARDKHHMTWAHIARTMKRGTGYQAWTWYERIKKLKGKKKRK